MSKKRERLEVIHDILKVISDSNNLIKPTKLQHSSNLSPQMFKGYLNELLTKEFIEQVEKKGKKHFKLTDKGYHFLDKYKIVLDFIGNFGL